MQDTHTFGLVIELRIVGHAMQMYSFTKNSFDVMINHIYEDCEGFNKNTKVQFETVYILENVNIAVQDVKRK